METGVIAGNAKNCLKKRRKGAFFYLPFSVFLEQKAFQIEIEHIRNTETAFWNGLRGVNFQGHRDIHFNKDACYWQWVLL